MDVKDLINLENGKFVGVLAACLIVIKILWAKTEKYQSNTDAKLLETEKRLEDCEKSKLEFFKQSLEETVQLEHRIEQLEKDRGK